MKKILWQWPAVLFLCACASPALGNGLRLVSQDGFATGRGEAFAATADNPSAIYYNPAGLTQLAGDNVRGGIYGIYLRPTFSPPSGGPSFSSSKDLAAAPEFFYAHTLEKLPVSLGLALYAPYGGSVQWPDNTGFRTVATESSLMYLRVNPVIAVKLPWGFSVAAGGFADYARLMLEQGLRPQAGPLLNYFRFTGHDIQPGFNLGLLWQPIEKISIGATFRSQTSFTLNGHTDFEQQPVIANTRLPAKMDFTFPWTAVGGISYRPTPKWNLEFDADYTDWSCLGTLMISQLVAPTWPVNQDIPVKLDWQGSWMFEFGVTRQFDNGWRVSAGYVFNENSVPDAFYSPLAADLDRHFFSLGVGRKGKRFDFDLAYQFGYGPAHTVSGSTPSSTPGQFAGQTADGTYGFTSHAVLASVGLHF